MLSLVSFLFQCSVAHHHLHSFPTRRSSDLSICTRARMLETARVNCTSRSMTSWATSDWRSMPSQPVAPRDRKSTRLNSSHVRISYAVFCLKKKNKAHGLPALRQPAPHHRER